MLDWLKKILGDTYTEDIDKKVSDEIGKQFVSRSDFNTLNETKKTLENTVDTLKQQNGDNEALQNTIKDHENTIAQLKKDAENTNTRYKTGYLFYILFCCVVIKVTLNEYDGCSLIT